MNPAEFVTAPDIDDSEDPHSWQQVIINLPMYRREVMDSYEQTDATANCCELDLLK